MAKNANIDSLPDINNKEELTKHLTSLFEAAKANGLEVLLLHTQTRTQNSLENTGHGYDAWRVTTQDEVLGLLKDDGGLFMAGWYVGGGIANREIEGLWFKTNSEAAKIGVDVASRDEVVSDKITS